MATVERVENAEAEGMWYVEGLEPLLSGGGRAEEEWLRREKWTSWLTMEVGRA